MASLQYQINPHFLFNTLQAIDSAVLMELGHYGKVNKMIGLFSKLIRYSIEDVSSPVLFEREIQMSKVYLELAALRRNRATVAIWDYDEDEVKNEEIIRFIFQPLLENAITHGSRTDGDSHLFISIEKSDNFLNCCVSDDGNGMDELELEKLKNSLSKPSEIFIGSHMGLRNVHTRLLLQYGPSSGLMIQSHIGKGTKVSFKIPLKTENYS